MISEDAILESLCDHAGIDAAQTGELSLRLEIRRAIKAAPDPQCLLNPASPEWQALLEASLVPETWFFRNMEAFEALARWVTASWLPAHPGERLNVLSLPCATGEEPYAIAMCLLEAGLTPDRFKIRAGDISEISLARAREASYRRNAFRTGFDEARFGKYFIAGGEGVRNVVAPVRGLVDFERLNLVRPTKPLPHSQVIFCRNALIYFGPETQREVIANLRSALSDDGILFLGPVEPPVALQCGFAPAKLPMAFACVKSVARQTEWVPPAPLGVKKAAGKMPNTVHLAPPDGKTGVPPVREDSASRLSANETTGETPVVPDRQDACPPAKLTVLGKMPAPPDRGRNGAFAPLPPPNRTGGSPASGSPVSVLLHYGDWSLPILGRPAGKRARVS